MTANQLAKRLTKNAVDFLLSGEKQKSDACMELLSLIQKNGYLDLKGSLMVDNT